MLQSDVQLSLHTTLKVGGAAQYFWEVASEDELVEAVTYASEHSLPIKILGGGSNVLVRDEGIQGLVIKNCLKGITSDVEGESVLLTAAAGEVLDDVVAHVVESGWWGLENFSHIPGSVGAIPVQNVGAYGREVKDVIVSVRVFDIATLSFRTLTNEECEFGYRDSIFKTPAGQSYVVTAVTFALSTLPAPHLDYKDLASRFRGETPSLTEIRTAIIDIRSKKFPDWHLVGTAGSFFKNPIIAEEKYAALLNRFPLLPGFPQGSGMMKVPLGWILDKALQLKGVREGAVGAYEGQALVLVNHGGATARDIEHFAESVIAKVKTEMDIEVEWEVTKW